MGDGEGEGVGGIMANYFAQPEESPDHLTHLGLVGATPSSHRTLHEGWGVLGDFHVGPLQRKEHHPPGVAELRSRLRVLVEEDPFDRPGRGPMKRDQAGELHVDDREPRGERRRRVESNDAVRYVGEPTPLTTDDAPSEAKRSGVEP